ncbi:phage tail tape measure protein, TP901 family [Streptomyces sp. OM5714]|nr:phage tail tape measure protein, TP901 family [Streptomyces sp. OM5714]
MSWLVAGVRNQGSTRAWGGWLGSVAGGWGAVRRRAVLPVAGRGRPVPSWLGSRARGGWLGSVAGGWGAVRRRAVLPVAGRGRPVPSWLGPRARGGRLGSVAGGRKAPGERAGPPRRRARARPHSGPDRCDDRLIRSGDVPAALRRERRRA